MCNPNYLVNAINTVLTKDLPDHLISIAISDQAKLSAGLDCDSDLSQDLLDTGIFSIQPFQ